MESTANLDKAQLENLCRVCYRKAQVYREIAEALLPDTDRLALGELAGIMECLGQAVVLVEKMIRETGDGNGYWEQRKKGGKEDD